MPIPILIQFIIKFKMKRLQHVVIFTVLLCLLCIIHNTKNIFAEVVVVHANSGWLRTDIILKGQCTMVWQVEKDDYWSFNPEIFPEGHNAEGIKVPALHSYALPGENIGMLLGRIGGGRIISMGLSGSEHIRPVEGGNYLYLTINDDLIGVYGKGYEDNTGEIKVTITQTPMRVIKIEILFIEGCPGYKFTKEFIEDIIANETIDVEITLIRLDNDEDARRLQFIGSPTVRVDGMDVEKNLSKTKDYSLKSRLYFIEGKASAYPSKSMIRNAIREAKLAKN